jgi:phosphatidate cytidylyltransferase
VFGLLVGGAGMLGDLAESLIKREAEAKDSGHSLGGLGGVLDLVDSLLFAAPVAWALWATGLAGL